MAPITISLIAFGFIFLGALLGLFLHTRLPEHHLSDNTKDVVKLGTGMIAKYDIEAGLREYVEALMKQNA